jgi:HPt (histidine-containing phosphotransfer) domain-containing protein
MGLKLSLKKQGFVPTSEPGDESSGFASETAGANDRMPTDCICQLDRDAVLDRVGGDEDLLKEITEIFLAEYPALIAEIRDAIQKQDAGKLEHSAHTLKGSVSNFGADAATNAAYQLEVLGRRGCLEQAPEALRALELHFAALAPALASLAGFRG